MGTLCAPDHRRDGRVNVFETAQGCPVVRIGIAGAQWKVSPVLSAWLRMHVPEAAHAEMMRFLDEEDEIGWTRLLAHSMSMGATPAPLIRTMTAEPWGDRIVHAAAQFTDGTCWTSDRLLLPHLLPEGLMTAMGGRALRDVIDNPYLPADAMIAYAEEDGANRGRSAIHLTA